jgi:hypothetical protein
MRFSSGFNFLEGLRFIAILVLSHLILSFLAAMASLS